MADDNRDAFKSLVSQEASPQVAQFLSGLKSVTGDYLEPSRTRLEVDPEVDPDRMAAFAALANAERPAQGVPQFMTGLRRQSGEYMDPQQPIRGEYDPGGGVIPLSLAPPPEQNPDDSIYRQAVTAGGDILQGMGGLAERLRLGALNVLAAPGRIRGPSEPYQATVPIEPGLRAGEGLATFMTGGLASPLAPAPGAFATAGRHLSEGLLADETGALTLREAQRRALLERRRIERLQNEPQPELPPLDTPTPPIGANSLGLAPPVEGVEYLPLREMGFPTMTMGRYSAPGSRALNPLLIPPNADVRTRRMLGRTDPSIGSPNNEEAIELPNGVHIGPVNTEQWVNRIEKVLGTGPEVDRAAFWYEDALPAYEKAFGKERAPAMLGAWLIANQNASPGDAQMNASRALEQYLAGTKGKPESPQAGLAASKLEQYWDAILSGDLSKLGDISTGQKIYDFIDSAIGKNTRTFYGDDPRAGRPAVADVHTLRDTGTTDPTLIDWVRRTYGDEVADRITPDPASSPSETKYEWSANRIRDITTDLNQMKWRGRDDWTPAQVQALGWKAMSQMMGRPGQTAAEAIGQNQRFLSYELDFGKGAPWNTTFPEWHTLSQEEKAAVSKPMLDLIMDKALEITGAKENWRKLGTGAWQQDLNPSFRSGLIGSHEAALDVANIVGYLGNQTATYLMRFDPAKANVTGLGVAVHGQGLDDPNVLGNIWKQVYSQHPDLAGGFSPTVNEDGVPGIHIGVPSGKEGKLSERELAALFARVNSELVPTLRNIGTQLPNDIDIGVAKVQQIEPTNNWMRQKNGQGHLQRLGPRYGPDIQQRLDAYSREELEPALRREIDETLRRRGGQGQEARKTGGPKTGLAAFGGAGLFGQLMRQAEAPPEPGQSGNPDYLRGLLFPDLSAAR
jgi:hypothetical protein